MKAFVFYIILIDKLYVLRNLFGKIETSIAVFALKTDGRFGRNLHAKADRFGKHVY